MIMIWVLWAVVIVMFLVLIVLLSVIYSELQRIADWSESVDFPEVEGFAQDELKRILLRAARLEFPRSSLGVRGRRRAFSRRAFEGWLRRGRFERLRDSLAEQGYLVKRGPRRSAKWTPKGRELLMGVQVGRWGDVYSGSDAEGPGDLDNQGSRYTVCVG